MREIKAIIWKEWSETRLFLWIAWGLFIGLPIIGGFEAKLTNPVCRFEFSASPLIILFGGVLAIIVGVACTCRDLQAKLEDFWQSRPMGSLRLFTIKYLMGLGVVLLACIVPLVVELLTLRNPSDAQAAIVLSLLWMAAFSTAFAAGCYFHRPSHAAAMAVLGVLLIYFVPIVFPPLGRFNVGNLLNYGSVRYFEFGDSPTGLILDFAGGMVVVAVLTGAAGILAVLKRWNIESGKPLIYAATACAFLILIESASFQLGSNLPVLSSATMSRWGSNWGVARLVANGSSGTATWRDFQEDGQQQREVAMPFTISGNQLSLGPSHEQLFGGYWLESNVFSPESSRDPRVFYDVSSNESEPNAQRIDTLTVKSEDGGVIGGAPIELWRGISKATLIPRARVWNDRLYVVGERSIVFDISDPLHPKRLSDDPTKWAPVREVLDSEEPTINLPPAPGMPAAERLKFALSAYYGDLANVAFDGTIFCRWRREYSNFGERSSTLEELKLSVLTDAIARFKLIGKHDAALMKWIVGDAYNGDLRMEGKFLYASQYNCISVFDLSESSPMRLVAHFAAPGIRAFEPLAGGCALVATAKNLYLLGPPASH